MSDMYEEAKREWANYIQLWSKNKELERWWWYGSKRSEMSVSSLGGHGQLVAERGMSPETGEGEDRCDK